MYGGRASDDSGGSSVLHCVCQSYTSSVDGHKQSDKSNDSRRHGMCFIEAGTSEYSDRIRLAEVLVSVQKVWSSGYHLAAGVVKCGCSINIQSRVQRTEMEAD
jgi:hypothetical protein